MLKRFQMMVAFALALATATAMLLGTQTKVWAQPPPPPTFITPPWDTTWTVDTTSVISWYSVAGATSYTIKTALDSAFTDSVHTYIMYGMYDTTLPIYQSSQFIIPLGGEKVWVAGQSTSSGGSSSFTDPWVITYYSTPGACTNFTCSCDIFGMSGPSWSMGEGETNFRSSENDGTYCLIFDNGGTFQLQTCNDWVNSLSVNIQYCIATGSPLQVGLIPGQTYTISDCSGQSTWASSPVEFTVPYSPPYSITFQWTFNPPLAPCSIIPMCLTLCTSDGNVNSCDNSWWYLTGKTTHADPTP